MGGIVWNEDTGNLVSGHQKVSIMDEVNRYNLQTHENDYKLNVEVVHLDLKTENRRELFQLLNGGHILAVFQIAEDGAVDSGLSGKLCLG